ncbi:MAG: hypothetical protein RRB13_12120 [bacterium]|nr:hypothetical protein [bacterium]
MAITLLSLSLPASAIERRQNQFLNEESYMFVPLPYSIPGIGQGVMFTGLAGNALGTYTDLYLLAITGDASGQILGLEDIHLVDETLIFNYFYQGLNKASVQMYEARGMDTQKDDFQFIVLDKVTGTDTNLWLTLWERRIEAYIGRWSQGVGVTAINDAEGNLLASYDESYTFENQTNYYGLRLDYTDDRQNPFAGVRLEALRTSSPPSNDLQPDYYVVTKSASAYIPIGKASTFAFHHRVSDAIVNREGETDPLAIAAEQGVTCNDADAACLAAVESLTATTAAERKYGTAEDLGGQNRLRAYPQSRFKGAHSLYQSAELRLTLFDEVTPFNFWIWKDVSTGIQLALFYEQGAASDDASELTSKLRTSNGAGIRMVSGSGYVYRFDLAQGDEGSQTTVMFAYPW